MNEKAWLALLNALPEANNSPLVLFNSQSQALDWIQRSEMATDRLWLVTYDDQHYWVVTAEVGQQLLKQGFSHLIPTHPLTPPPVSIAPGDEMV